MFQEIIWITGHDQQHKDKEKWVSLWMLVFIWAPAETFSQHERVNLIEFRPNVSHLTNEALCFSNAQPCLKCEAIHRPVKSVSVLSLQSGKSDVSVKFCEWPLWCVCMCVCVCAASVSVSSVSVRSHATGFNPSALIPRLLRAAA